MNELSKHKIIQLPEFIADKNGNIDGEQIHKFLNVKTAYRKWAPRVVEDCYLVEGVDFINRSKMSSSNNGLDKVGYNFTPDAVKAIGMKKGTGEQGKAIRNYFIEAEKAGRQLAEAIKNADPIVLRKLADVSEKNQKLQQDKEVLETNLTTAKEEIESIKPMAEYGHNVFISSNLYTVTNIGQMIGLSGAALNGHLKRLQVIRKGTGKYTDWELCMRYAKHGLVKYKETPGMSATTGEAITHRALRWTRRGFDWLVENGDLLKNPARKSLPLPKQEIINRGA